jgi:hypothetical protein
MPPSLLKIPSNAALGEANLTVNKVLEVFGGNFPPQDDSFLAGEQRPLLHRHGSSATATDYFF